jgi:hypothetical protein
MESSSTDNLRLRGAVPAADGSIRTAPVNQSAGPLPDGREPFRVMSMVLFRLLSPVALALM